jgi:hypothetical protein
MKKLAGFTLALGAIPSLLAAQLPPIRPIGAVSAKSTETFGQSVFVRHLKNGVLVNDMMNRRVLLLDADLKSSAVVADTTSATANAYSGRTANLIAFPGDSSLFVDGQSMSMLVIDGAGQVKRVMALPRPQDAMVLGNPMLGTPAFDASQRLVYRGMPRFEFGGRGGPGRAEQRAERGAQGAGSARGDRPQGGAGTAGGQVVGGGQGGPAFVMPEMPDTAPVVRLDLKSREIDTVFYTKIPRPKLDVQRDEGTGRVSVQTIINPLPTVDDWAVLSDGSIAVVRGRDYHVDFIRPDGKVESAPKIPFEWQRLTDEDKVAFIDSVKAARARLVASMPQPAAGANSTTSAGGAPGASGGTPNIRIEMGPGGDGGPRGGMGMAREPMFVQPQELPDYKPAFFSGQLRADMDGNLWIRTIPTKGIAGGPVYDVINGKGELVDRVQVPANTLIAGFGTGGVVYLVAAEGDKRFIERASIK